MRHLPQLSAVTALCLSSPVHADLQCRNGVCADIQALDEIVLIPEESDLDGTSNRDISTVENYCALSYRQADGNPTSYDIAFQTGTSASDVGGGFFQIGNNGPDIKMEWRGNPDSAYADISSSGLSNDTAGARFCSDRNAMASIRATLNASQLQSIQPGRYSGELSMDMGQGSNLYHSRIPFQITLPDLYKISGLDDIVLTEKVPNRSFYRKDERFCVFVWGGGSYTIRANGGTGNQFLLSNGSDTINYMVRLSKAADGSSLETVSVDQAVTSTAGSNSLSCNGQNNARVRIRINDSELAGKSAGVYSGTLSLTVEAS
ncbi:hypothetical protein EOPP23_01880 [Endozoicomonas sp. OPT23]|uniref:hypothetical protein n=1 Tax=Endozoicomonas sp. OPT23 TaxID=2072845 RepID=UPI00129B15B9|nr:hypothetical protein [Endozoicomonas sp. OPT23]MRI31745.1 hypothetical protein [Endozoicomonas sp. OPT23]